MFKKLFRQTAAADTPPPAKPDQSARGAKPTFKPSGDPVEQYEALVRKGEPVPAELVMQVGDIYRDLGRREQAATCYGEAAARFVADERWDAAEQLVQEAERLLGKTLPTLVLQSLKIALGRGETSEACRQVAALARMLSPRDAALIEEMISVVDQDAQIDPEVEIAVADALVILARPERSMERLKVAQQRARRAGRSALVEDLGRRMIQLQPPAQARASGAETKWPIPRPSRLADEELPPLRDAAPSEATLPSPMSVSPDVVPPAPTTAESEAPALAPVVPPSVPAASPVQPSVAATSGRGGDAMLPPLTLSPLVLPPPHAPGTSSAVEAPAVDSPARAPEPPTRARGEMPPLLDLPPQGSLLPPVPPPPALPPVLPSVTPPSIAPTPPAALPPIDLLPQVEAPAPAVKPIGDVLPPVPPSTANPTRQEDAPPSPRFAPLDPTPMIEVVAESPDPAFAPPPAAEESVLPPRPAFLDLEALRTDGEGASSARVVGTDGLETADSDDAQIRHLIAELEAGLAAQIPADEAETYYDLGITFLQMRQWDQAVKHFQVAFRSKGYRLRAAEGLAQAFLGRGDALLAHRAVRTVLADLTDDDAQTVGLLYWMARASEDLGRREDAIDLYERVAVQDAQFFDALERLKRLTA